LTARAAFAPGEAREDWAILRALSDVLGKKLPYDSLAAVARRALCRASRISRLRHDFHRLTAAQLPQLRRKRAEMNKAAFASPVKDFYLTNPIARASAVMAECFGLGEPDRQGRGGGIRAGNTMDGFITTYVWPGAIILAQSLLLLVALLIFIAYILYADRKIWAAVQLAPRSERGRAVGSVAVLCRPSEIRLQGAGDSIGRQQGRFPARPAGGRDAGAGRWAVIPVDEAG
jgi:hypothetical protein